MGADEVAVIRPALLELEAALAGPEDAKTGPLCATFEVEPDCDRWIQVVLGAPDTLNIYYPFPEHPLERLHCVRKPWPAGLNLTGYEAGTFATFSFDRQAAIELARFLDAVFVDLLQCREDEYPRTVKLFHLAR